MLSAGKASNTPSLSYLEYVNPPAPMSQCSSQGFDLLSLPQERTLLHYSDNIMLTGPREQEVAPTLDVLVRLVCQRVGNKSDKKLGVFYLSEISEVQWCGAC